MNHDLIGLEKAASLASPVPTKMPVRGDYATIPDYDAAMSAYEENLRQKYLQQDTARQYGPGSTFAKERAADAAAQAADDARFRADRPDGSSPASRATVPAHKAPAKPAVKPVLKKKVDLDNAVWAAAADMCMCKAAAIDPMAQRALKEEEEYQKRLKNPNYTPMTRQWNRLTSVANARQQAENKAQEAYNAAVKARNDYYKKNIYAGKTGWLHPINSIATAWNRFRHGDDYKKLRTTADQEAFKLLNAKNTAYNAVKNRDEFNTAAGKLGFDTQTGKMKNPYKIQSTQVYTPSRQYVQPGKFPQGYLKAQQEPQQGPQQAQ